MKVFQKNNGAVTLFLILILVPVLALSGIFVEISRIELAKPILTSSADLALNTALTNYDSKLKEYYGLMGSSQDTKDTLDVAEEYFKNCLNSQLVDEELLDQWWEKVTGIANNGGQLIGRDNIITTEQENIANLLLMEIPELTASGVSNANLSNPVFLQSQIVEFMKYRAPVELVTGLLERLKNQHKQIQYLDKDEDLQEKEQAAYEAENELLERLYDIYCELENYQSLGITENYITEMKETIRSDKVNDLYSSVHERAVKRYINIDISDPFFLLDDMYFNEIPPKGELVSMDINANTVTRLLTDIEDFEDAKKTLDQKFNQQGVYNQAGNSDLDDVQFAVQTYRKNASQIKAYMDQAIILGKKYNEVYTIYQRRNEETVKNELQNIQNSIIDMEGNTVTLYQAIEEVYDYYDSFITKKAFTNSKLSDEKTRVLYILNKINNVCSDAAVVNEVAGTADDSDIRTMHSQLNGYREKMQTGLSCLQNVLNMVEKDGIFEKSLYQLATEYSNTINTWDSSANYSQEPGSYCQESKQRVQETVNRGEAVSQEDIVEFQKRVQASYNYLSGVLAYITEDLKYGETNIVKIQDLGDFVSAAKTICPEENINGKVTKGDLKQLADQRFQPSVGNHSLSPESSGSNHPDMSKNSPHLYTYIREKFKGLKNDEKYNNAKETYKKIKDDPDAEEDREIEAEESTVAEINGLKAENYPSGFTDTSSKISIFSSILSLAGNLAQDWEGTLKDARDTLYVTEYCMSMFSYASYENEMKYNYMTAHDLQEEQLDKLSTKYALSQNLINDTANGITDSAEKEKINNLTQNEDPNNPQNMSLTNKPINSDNNYAYQREIEYILFGNENKNNLKDVKEELFTLRYSFNLIPGYRLFWNNDLISNVANSISAATSGIIPAPLMKVVMILALVGAESWNDVQLLTQGIPVRLYKSGSNATEAEWVVSLDRKFSDILSEYGGGATDTQDGQPDKSGRMFYSDYLTLLLYVQLSSSNETKVNAVYKRIGDVIQANMAEKIYENSDYQLSKCITQFSLSYSAVVKPLVFQLGIYNGYHVDALISDEKWRTISGTMARGY